MKYLVRHLVTICRGVGLGVLLTACSSSSVTGVGYKSRIQNSGEDALAKSFGPIDQTPGKTITATANRDTQMRGEDGSCLVASGTTLYLFAERQQGDHKLFRATLDEPCMEEGLALVEGEVDSADLDLDSFGESVFVAAEEPDRKETDPQGSLEDGDLQTEAPEGVIVGEGLYQCRDISIVQSRNQRQRVNEDDQAPWVDKIRNVDTFILGTVFRAQHRDIVRREYSLTIRGNAPAWRLHVRHMDGGRRAAEDGADLIDQTDPVILESAQYQEEPNTFVVPFREFIPKNTWRSDNLFFTATPMDNQEEVAGPPCEIAIRMISPLVLDFSPLSPLQTTSVVASSVRFDLDGDGHKEATGWVQPTDAFLVLDIDANGTIDSGRELFGDYSSLSNGKHPKNGFSALKSYDDNGDKTLDPRDSVFSRLQLWFDRNGDGISQKSELEALATRDVARISTDYVRNVSTQEILENDHRFVGRFFGPDSCGHKGCVLTDVYFSALKSVLSTNPTPNTPNKPGS